MHGYRCYKVAREIKGACLVLGDDRCKNGTSDSTLFIVRWRQSNIAFALPIGIADFLLISGAISLTEKMFSNGQSSDEEDG